MYFQKSLGSFVLLVIGFVQIDAQLMCWSCSSDLDIRCHDHFNTTKFDRFYQQQQGNYGNNYQGGNYQSGNYNPNYPQQNYQNRGGFQNNPYQTRPTAPYIKPCVFSSYGDKKSVCMKKVQTSNDGRTTTIRDCATIPMSQSVGKCPSESNSYIHVDFCEYCDVDGCNSGNNMQFNLFLTALSVLSLLCLKQ
ncbi:hypothetical protein HHI36_014204 [Cryptolaemus montrouzieri]|uniref:Protein sleepless n=1 Tax=Cryptolaemus montrouzieri TaxID=559131 RepID=A0ABD2N2U6_9CUCU